MTADLDWTGRFERADLSGMLPAHTPHRYHVAALGLTASSLERITEAPVTEPPAGRYSIERYLGDVRSLGIAPARPTVS